MEIQAKGILGRCKSSTVTKVQKVIQALSAKVIKVFKVLRSTGSTGAAGDTGHKVSRWQEIQQKVIKVQVVIRGQQVLKELKVIPGTCEEGDIGTQGAQGTGVSR